MEVCDRGLRTVISVDENKSNCEVRYGINNRVVTLAECASAVLLPDSIAANYEMPTCQT